MKESSLSAQSTPPQTLYRSQRFSVVAMQQTLPEGDVLTREVVVHPGSVVIVPLVGDDHVCLIRNFRVAVGKWLLELPAGTLDHDEPPRATAERELIEETGFRAACWRELPGFYLSPGILCERMHVFVASELASGAPQREQGEQIDNHVVRWEDALAMTTDGRIEDAKTIAALLMWERLRRGVPT